MLEIPNIIPITVVVATLLFFLRELFDGIRRYKNDSRKIHALRKFAAADCERNQFTISRLQHQINEIEHAIDVGNEIMIDLQQNGNPVLTINRHNEGRIISSSPIPFVHTRSMEKFLFDAAIIDAALFDRMEAALDTLNEIVHIRESLIEYITGDRGHLDGFIIYAKEVLDVSIDPVRDLYFHCTGTPLVQGRVR